ncbi:hypothetical protein D3C78_1200360 [compost metagenome]
MATFPVIKNAIPLIIEITVFTIAAVNADLLPFLNNPSFFILPPIDQLHLNAST